MKKFLYALSILLLLSTSSIWAQVDMSKVVTLSVKNGKKIFVNFKANQNNTDVLIQFIEGAAITSSIPKIAGTEFLPPAGGNTKHSVVATGSTMKIYGNISVLAVFSNTQFVTTLDISGNLSITEVDCNNNSLTSLVLGNNTNLTTLNCRFNHLTTLDVSNNTNLTTLNCGDNQLTTLDLGNSTNLTTLNCSYNQLTTLDVSNNTNLTTLNCSYNQLTTLDLGNNTNLTTLNCGDNQLTTLDLGNSTNLTTLSCSYNQLTTLDVENNTNLTTLYCNNNQLTTLDVSNNTNLTTLSCTNNQLTTLDVSNSTKLNYLYCNNNQLTTLDVSNNTKLTDIRCYANQLTSLDVGNNTMLNYLYCNNNQLTTLDVGKNIELINLYCYENPFSTETVNKLYCSLPDRTGKATKGKCHPLNKNTDPNHATIVAATSKIAKDKNWDVLYYDEGKLLVEVQSAGNYDCNAPPVDKIKFVTLSVKNGENIFVNFKAAQDNTTVLIEFIENNAITESKYITAGTDFIQQVGGSNHSVLASGSTMKIYGDINNLSVKGNFNNVTAIDLSNNTQIVGFSCFENNLTSLVLGNNTNLQHLSCEKNKLTSLDVSNNTGLQRFFCNDNLLTTLDISNNAKLEVLECKKNQINSLNTSNSPELAILDCDNNQLPALDLSKNTKLTNLRCATNYISSLNVSNNALLVVLHCNNNHLTALDVSNNTKLSQLFCNNNNITALDLSKNIKLEQVRCYGNPFTTEAVNKLYCSLPDRTGEAVKGSCYTLNKNSDGNYAIVSAATSKNAVSKNWQVLYYNDAIAPQEEIPSSGNYDCSGTPPPPPPPPPPPLNYSIKLSVSNGAQIKMDFRAAKNKTPIRIQTGNKVIDLEVNNEWYSSSYTVSAESDNITIKGEIVGFYCGDNSTKLTNIDVSENTILTELLCPNNQLTSLNLGNNIELKVLHCYYNHISSLNLSNNKQIKEVYCDFNELTALDLSKNTNLETIRCYGNLFNTEAVNQFYCNLPDRSNKAELGNCYTLNTIGDNNKTEVVAASSDNARKKKWNVKYWNNKNSNQDNIPNNGGYDCKTGKNSVYEYTSSGITVFPNPAYGKVQVNLDSEVNETLILVDLTGRALLSADVVDGKANIDVSNLTAGTYFIRVGNRVQKITVK